MAIPTPRRKQTGNKEEKNNIALNGSMETIGRCYKLVRLGRTLHALTSDEDSVFHELFACKKYKGPKTIGTVAVTATASVGVVHVGTLHHHLDKPPEGILTNGTDRLGKIVHEVE